MYGQEKVGNGKVPRSGYSGGASMGSDGGFR